MDERSHELFAEILLKAVGKSETSPKWGTAPDIDAGFLHRWYRHRISVLPKVFREFPTPGRLHRFWISDADPDAITLCVVSHLYLDIFNGWIFPFGIWNPIYPKKTVINGVFEDIDKPKLLVKELRRLGGEESYYEQFYTESGKIMGNFILEKASLEDLVAHMIMRLASYASANASHSLFDRAVKQIEDFTLNKEYSKVCISTDIMHEVCGKFEIEYAKLINKALEE